MILNNFKKWNNYLDTDTNTMLETQKSINSSGWFHKDEISSMSKLYVETGKLFFEIETIKIELTDQIKVQHKKIEKIDEHSVKKKLLLYKKRCFKPNILICSIDYIAEFGYSFWNPFDNEDDTEECEDWGLFISNILQNKEWQLNIINLKSK